MKTRFVYAFLILIGFVFGVSDMNAQSVSLDTNFTPALDGFITGIVVQPDQKILISGTFNNVNGTSRNKVARLNQDGTLDTSFNPNAIVLITNSVSSVKVLADGKILLTGYFGDVGLNGFKRVLRINANGSADSTFTTFPYTVGAGTVASAEGLANGKILMCGDFTSPNNTAQSYLARYNADGSFDTDFLTTINAPCRDTVKLPNGKVIIGGLLSAVNGVSQRNLAQFDQNGNVDTDYRDFYNNEQVYKLGVQPDGKILSFATGGNVYAGSAKLIRVGNNGFVQDIFPISVSGIGLSAIAFQTNGKVLIGGSNMSDGNGNATRFARLTTFGNYDLSLNQLNFNDDVKTIAVQADGKILVGGLFQTVNGVTRPYLARLNVSDITRKPAFDFDGDLKADVSVFRPSTGTWYLNRSSAGFTAAQFGIASDKLVSADYDGDGKTDIAVYRNNASNNSGVLYTLKSSTSTFTYEFLGITGDIPQPGDYDGDGRAELALFSTATQTTFWSIRRSAQGYISLQIGGELPTDKPFVGDYDGDGITDIAVYRDGLWLIRKSTTNTKVTYQFGAPEDRPVSGDFDGDGKTDIAVFRPSSSVWYFQNSSQGLSAVQFGISTDLPVPADYDGDGKTDVAVYRNGIWYQLRSNGNVFYGEQFGLSEDFPIPAQP